MRNMLGGRQLSLENYHCYKMCRVNLSAAKESDETGEVAPLSSDTNRALLFLHSMIAAQRRQLNIFAEGLRIRETWRKDTDDLKRKFWQWQEEV